MKRGAPGHPKMGEFARSMGIPRWQAVGLMESLYHFAANYAKRGNIGRWTNKRIMAGIEYEGDGDALIEAMVQAGLVDRDPTYRLLIHDWHDHADQTVSRSQEVKAKGFAMPTTARQCTEDVSASPDDPSANLASASETLASENSGSLEAGLPKPKPKPVPEPMPKPKPVTGNQEEGSSQRKTPTVLAIDLARWLRLSSPRDPAQAEIDARDCHAMANRILLGQIGPVDEALVQSQAKAEQIALSPGVKNRIAAFKAWFGGRLEAHGHSWGNGKGVGGPLARLLGEMDPRVGENGDRSNGATQGGQA